LAFNILSTLVKLVAAVLTGSVSLLSEAAHSFTDIFASAIALASVRAAAVPPDEEHPFGHGKIESLAGFGESILLFGVVVYVVIEAIQRLVTPQPIMELDLGIVVMVASAVGAFLVSRFVGRIASQTGSLALKSNAQHLMVDFVTSAGVLGGLVLAKATGATWADSVLALGFAVWMAWGAWKLSFQAFHDLIDIRLPDEEIHQVRTLIESEPQILGFHRLRTRRSGSMRFIDMHIVVPREWTVVEAHDLADRLEKRIALDLQPATVVIHVDPYDPQR
jgi:cation diffusion facilitator family transporter